jgi:hypothetical protein
MDDVPDGDSPLVLRGIDDHSGRSDVIGDVRAVALLHDVVARVLENGREGSRFPLLRLVGRKVALTHEECDALVREIARLRGLLAAHAVEALRAPTPDLPSDPALAAALPLDAVPEPFPRLNGNGAPRTLADAFARPLFVLEHVCRLGAAGRRGARFETGPGDALVAVRSGPPPIALPLAPPPNGAAAEVPAAGRDDAKSASAPL